MNSDTKPSAQTVRGMGVRGLGLREMGVRGAERRPEGEGLGMRAADCPEAQRASSDAA
jgi:hypothetical protein